MFTNKSLEASNSLADRAAASAKRAIDSTARVADEASRSLSDSAPMLDRAGDQIGALARRGADAVRDGTHQLHDKALRASDRAVHYVQDEPVKSMLIAAAAGAALFALLGALRSRRH